MGRSLACTSAMPWKPPVCRRIARVRLGSLEPEQLSVDVIARLAKQEKLCPQFHLSLQSGCDATLRRMNRHYTADEYRTIVRNLRASFANCAITTDIMVGFPGETEEEFAESSRSPRKSGLQRRMYLPIHAARGPRQMTRPIRSHSGSKRNAAAG